MSQSETCVKCGKSSDGCTYEWDLPASLKAGHDIVIGWVCPKCNGQPPTEIDTLRAQITTLTSERDEARERCRTLSEEVRAWRKRTETAVRGMSAKTDDEYEAWSQDQTRDDDALERARAKTDTTSALTPEGTQP